jgi:hypothetical protein
MAVSDIDIASQALGLIRANTISSFDDGSNEADICSLFYENFARDILTRYPWTFATKKARLSRNSTSPLNEYRYAHVFPSECEKLWALFPDDEVGVKPIKEFDIQAPDGTRMIFSDYEDLWADYTVYTDESNWPPYFIHFAIHAFADLIAMPITDQPEIAERMGRLAYGFPQENGLGGKFGIACKIDAMQKPGEFINSSPLIEARFS